MCWERIEETILYHVNSSSIYLIIVKIQRLLDMGSIVNPVSLKTTCNLHNEIHNKLTPHVGQFRVVSPVILR